MKKMFKNIKAYLVKLFYGSWITVKVLDGYWVDEKGRPVSHVAYLIQNNTRRNELRIKMEGNNPEQHITYVAALKVLARANSLLYDIHIPDIYEDGKMYTKKISDLVLSLEAELSGYVQKEEFEDANEVKYYLDHLKYMMEGPREESKEPVETEELPIVNLQLPAAPESGSVQPD